MRHNKKKRHLGRDHDHRKALRKNLIRELFENERIRTTSAKAKFVRGEAEKLITLARNRGDLERIIELAEDGDEETLNRILTKGQAARVLRWTQSDERFYEDKKGNERDHLEDEVKGIVVHAQRLARKRVTDRDTLDKLFYDIGPRYFERSGGYTRIIKLGPRKGDAAEMVFLELVEGEEI